MYRNLEYFLDHLNVNDMYRQGGSYLWSCGISIMDWVWSGNNNDNEDD